MGALINGALIGQSVVERAISELLRIPEDVPDPYERFMKLDNVNKAVYSIEEGFKLLRAASFCLTEDVWDELPLEIRRKYNYQFQIYAIMNAPDLGWSTIQNQMRAARTFLIKGIRPKDDRPFDPIKIPISKLVLARSVAENGSIHEKPELWTMLTDSKVTFGDIRSTLFANPKLSPEISYALIGPTLVASQHGMDAVIIDDCGFNWECYYDDECPEYEIVKKSVDRILSLFNIKKDEDIIIDQTIKELSNGIQSTDSE